MTFRPLEGDIAVLVQNGVYRQADLYEWDGKLFAKHGVGYVRLRANGTTSRDGIHMEYMEIETPLYADKLGRLTVTDRDGYKRIDNVTLQIEEK